MDKKNHNKCKVTLGMLKGKPIMSSVPSIAIRFNSTSEAIEELYVSDGERGDSVGEIGSHTNAISDSESSPARATCGSKLSKRSTSIDVTNPADSSPPSDPWRFFTDIKGKITKSVEGRITEYKSRTAEGENSPKTSKPNKEKENSSLSDSEELSESSISRTCGIVSTTEGAEMSSDDETTSLSDKDKDRQTESAVPAPNVKKKYRIVRDKEVKQEGLMSSGFLENLQNINMGLQDKERSEIESGIDALLQFENVTMDGEEMLIKQVAGTEIRHDFLLGFSPKESTVLAPTGYVDLRCSETNFSVFNIMYSFRVYIIALIGAVLYFSLPLSAYSYGFVAGNLVMLTAALFYIKVFIDNPTLPIHQPGVPILEIAAAREVQPAIKYEGWVNEYPESYDPYSYHISQTQSVYLRLQGNLLKISHTKSKIPKRALWNEAQHKLVFTRHRIYNLLGARIYLLPHGLTKIRHWSKKYPICITLEKNQYNFDYPERNVERQSTESFETLKSKKKQYDVPQVFSKLADEALADTLNDNGKVDEDDGACHPNKEFLEDSLDPELESMAEDLDNLNEYFQEEDVEEWPPVRSELNSDETSIYIFARTDREKEHWYRRLASATHKQVHSEPFALKQSGSDIGKVESDTINTNHILQTEYLKFMSRFTPMNADAMLHVIDPAWLNALITRVSFDLIRNPMFVSKIKERIQRKLSAIKLPYFIEELTLSELSLGSTPPCIREIQKPVMDEWGLWVDLHTTYEGNVKIILQTKLNLMKLKQPPPTVKTPMEKSPIFNSDVDDTAESSTDDEAVIHLTSANVQGPLDAAGYPIPGLGGTSNKGKKLIRMVDRIAESKFFQAAAENKYIKRAIEGVSNTELGLKVEVKALDGVLVLNIPTPPSDRVWVGFRPSPKLVMKAHPIVGERNINFLQVTSWIERKLFKEFQKLLVIPNMEDIHISVMMQMLPK